jgi:transcriptional regulator with XRE-family HTH domain
MPSTDRPPRTELKRLILASGQRADGRRPQPAPGDPAQVKDQGASGTGPHGAHSDAARCDQSTDGGMAALFKTLGDLLASLRADARLSQQQLADRIGYSRATIAGAEAASRMPSGSFWKRADDMLAGNGTLHGAYRQLADARAAKAREALRQADTERDERINAKRAELSLPPLTSQPPEQAPASAPAATWTPEMPAGRSDAHDAMPHRAGSDSIAELRRRLGEALAVLREMAGFNQTELARRINYDRTTIAHAERGAQIPAAEFWQACDSLLGAHRTLIALYRQWQEAKEEQTEAARLRARRERQSTIADLLGPPSEPTRNDLTDTAAELRARLAAARAIDDQMVRIFQEQIDLARVVDRRLGGVTLLAELRQRIAQMSQLLHSSLNANTRESLARVLVDACTLAGWVSLDQGSFVGAWELYAFARTTAREAESPALEAYACGGQSTVLLDIRETRAAVELTEYARMIAHDTAPCVLRSWLAGAYGEACAAAGEKAPSLAAFDEAERLLSGAQNTVDARFLVFDRVHLARWRGNALARLGDREAVDVLSRTLRRLDATFTRAEAAMRVDLACAFQSIGEMDAVAAHADRALTLSLQIGSVRQRARIERLRVGRSGSRPDR